MKMVTLGNDEKGYLYVFKDRDLSEILIYDEVLQDWINVIDLLREKYPQHFEKHKFKSEILYSEHLLSMPDCLSEAKAQAEMDML